jgi:hypothetical protein
MSQTQIKKNLYRAFDPKEALLPDDPRYVECDEERRSSHLLDALDSTIRLADKPTCQLLSGHRGCGKTTELFNLRKRLTADATYAVVYCEADDYLDFADTVEATDVLLAIIQQVWKDANAQSIALAPGHLQKFFTDLWDTLSLPLRPEEVKLKLPVLEMGFKFRHESDYRRLVREHLRPRAADFLQAVNELLAKAAVGFRNSDANCEGLVVIVDNLDRLLRRSISGATFTSHDELFIHSASQLSELACHIIFTLPPALLHSPNGANLRHLYGTPPRMLPMIPVNTRTGAPFLAGIEKLIETVQRRVQFAGEQTAFADDETITRLCQISGGYVRNLMTLVQEALRYTRDLPINREAAELAISESRNNLTGALRPSHWPLLREIAATNHLSESDLCAELLDIFAVLQYLDDKGSWYDISPVLRETNEFAV